MNGAKDSRLFEVLLANLEKLQFLTDCKRKRVVTGLFDSDARMVAHGVNGWAGFANRVPCSNVVGNCGCIHAEVSLAIRAARTLNSELGSLFIVQRYAPCTNCANTIVFLREYLPVDAFYWREDTLHDPRGVEILLAGGLDARNWTK